MNFLKLVMLLNIFLVTSCEDNNAKVEEEQIGETNETNYFSKKYSLVKRDDFSEFNPENWSKGLKHDADPTVKMIWNTKSGGEHLLNDNYAGYLLDENVYTKNGHLFLDNKKQVIQGINPVGTFNYSTGWINSLQKINFNGTQKNTYIQLKAKFPKGDKVWPAIWLIDDSENRGWPPEIDIWEYFGIFFNTVKTDQMYMRFIYGKWNDKKDHSVPIENFQEKYNAVDEWHIYGFEWTHEKMNWFIDGEKVHTKTKGGDVPAGDWPDKKMCLVINNGLLNVVDEGNTTFPNSLILDYLEIYEQ
jgi:beta-glucanase (GH16 family)